MAESGIVCAACCCSAWREGIWLARCPVGGSHGVVSPSRKTTRHTEDVGLSRYCSVGHDLGAARCPWNTGFEWVHRSAGFERNVQQRARARYGLAVAEDHSDADVPGASCALLRTERVSVAENRVRSP